MIDVAVRDTGDSSGIVAWTETIEDPREALQAITEVMRDDIAERFDTETDPWGRTWAPVSITTIEIRLKQGKDPTPGRFTPRARITDGGKSTRIGFVGNPHAEQFHLGNPSNRVFGRGLGPRPPRAILPLRGGAADLPDDLREDIMDAFRGEIREAVRAMSGGD